MGKGLRWFGCFFFSFSSLGADYEKAGCAYDQADQGKKHLIEGYNCYAKASRGSRYSSRNWSFIWDSRRMEKSSWFPFRV